MDVDKYVELIVDQSELPSESPNANILDVTVTAGRLGGLVKTDKDGEVPVANDTAQLTDADKVYTWQLTLSPVHNTGEMGVHVDLPVDFNDLRYKTTNESEFVGKDLHLTIESPVLYHISGDDDVDDFDEEDDGDECFLASEGMQKPEGSPPARSGASQVIIPIDMTDSQVLDDTVPKDSDDDRADEVHFHVGSVLQEMIGRKSQLAEVSPVFKAMFEGRLQEASGVVTVPDVEPWAFDFLLRFAAHNRRKASEFDLDLAHRADDVWEVLKASDKYDVGTLTDTCFRFLSQQHPRRRRSHHWCSVLELAHRLNYTQHHQQTLIHVKQHAARLLKNPRALAELCPQCMLHIVMADDLKGADEILVHDAVLVWAHHACVNQRNLLPSQWQQLSPSDDAGAVSPSWEELRFVAGDLVKHVRYLTINKHTLAGFRVGDPTSCLLTAEEMRTLLNDDASLFPDTVRVKRGKAKPAKKPNGKVAEERLTNRCIRHFAILLTILVLMIFMVIYIPVYLAVSDNLDNKASTMAPLLIRPGFGGLE